jgi:hypothetical protein
MEAGRTERDVVQSEEHVVRITMQFVLATLHPDLASIVFILTTAHSVPTTKEGSWLSKHRFRASGYRPVRTRDASVWKSEAVDWTAHLVDWTAHLVDWTAHLVDWTAHPVVGTRYARVS